MKTGAVVTSRRGLSGIERGKGICYQWKEKGQYAVSDTSLSHQHQEVEVRREKGSSEAEASL